MSSNSSWVLVTGANRGLGYLTAKQLVADGQSVIVGARTQASGAPLSALAHCCACMVSADRKVSAIAGRAQGVMLHACHYNLGSRALASTVAALCSTKHSVFVHASCVSFVHAANDAVARLGEETSHPERVAGLAVDISDPKSIEAAAQTLERDYAGKLGGLINNAAVRQRAPLSASWCRTSCSLLTYYPVRGWVSSAHGLCAVIHRPALARAPACSVMHQHL